MKRHRGGTIPCAGLALLFARAETEPDPTVALWPFDEQRELSPSRMSRPTTTHSFSDPEDRS